MKKVTSLHIVTKLLPVQINIIGLGTNPLPPSQGGVIP